MDRGHVWAAIRSELSHLRDDMRRAVEAGQYEAESAIFDHMARQLADAVCKRAERLAEAT